MSKSIYLYPEPHSLQVVEQNFNCISYLAQNWDTAGYLMIHHSEEADDVPKQFHVSAK